MSFPTTLSPWFVVQRLNRGRVNQPNEADDVQMEYYTAEDEGHVMFQTQPGRAMLFMSLSSASRVASSEGAEVRVLVTKEEAKEFGRS